MACLRCRANKSPHKKTGPLKRKSGAFLAVLLILYACAREHGRGIGRASGSRWHPARMGGYPPPPGKCKLKTCGRGEEATREKSRCHSPGDRKTGGGLYPSPAVRWDVQCRFGAMLSNKSFCCDSPFQPVIVAEYPDSIAGSPFKGLENHIMGKCFPLGEFCKQGGIIIIFPSLLRLIP